MSCLAGAWCKKHAFMHSCSRFLDKQELEAASWMLRPGKADRRVREAQEAASEKQNGLIFLKMGSTQGAKIKRKRR